MGFMDEYYKALEDESKKSSSSGSGGSGGSKSGGFMDEYNKAIGNTKTNTKSSLFTRDIAPISDSVFTRMTVSRKKEEEEKKKKRKWFDKGLFEDGYDFGDISRTILGSTADVLENVGSGIIGMGEKAVDAMAYVSPYIANGQFYQNGGFYKPEQVEQQEKAFEQSKKDVGKFISKDLYDEEKIARAIISDPARKIGIDSETQSVFGEKSDALIQSGGQLLATAGLQAVGVPWFVTTGATSFGSEAENALNQDASYEAAGASAAISAGAEILSEKLSGGISFGGKTLDDALTKQLARGISNKLGRTAAKLGLDMAGEGAEEVFSQIASNLGSSLYKEEDITELLFNEEAMDGYLESFIGGAALGGVAGGYNAVKSAGKGVDYASGLTENEKKVVDKLYKDEIASLEKEGKVTQKEKSKIYDSILEDMEKGYISIDTIEEVLGGESYSAYKNTVDSEDAILKEYDELGEKQNATPKDYARYTELTEKVKDIHSNSQRDTLRAKLNEDVMGLVKGSRLAESYNERTRSGQKFEADVTKYDAKQQAVVQKAIDSGILNNSNRTHEFVDFVSKISADTGVLFDFSNTQQLREAGYVMEGQTIDGFYNPKEGITVNIDSPKSRQFVVGHEITHALEGTELYDALRKSVFDYAKMKNQYGVRMESIQKRYKEGTDFEAELTAELVGEYIFSDTDFINNLSTQNRNVFQKVYDEIKYLCKVATAGSKEARELEKVKRAFEKAYREGGKAQVETKYSLSDSDGKQLTKEQQEYFKDSKARDENGSLIPVYHGTFEDFNVFDINKTSSINDFGKGHYFTSNLEDASTNYASLSGGDVQTKIDGAAYDIFTEEMGYSEDDLYDNDYIEEYNKAYDEAERRIFSNPRVVEAYLNITNPIIVREDGEYDSQGNKIAPDADRTSYDGMIDYTVSNKFPGQKLPEGTTHFVVYNSNQIKATDNLKPTADPDIRYSLSDSNGRELSKEQSEYFKDSKVRDKNGSLQVMYHGSPESFTVFDKKKAKSSGLYGKGFYFTNSDSHAKQYGNTYEVYLNITNPLQNGTNDITKDQLRNFVEAIAEDEDYGIENYGYEATVDSVTDNVFGKGDFAMLMDINVTCVGNMVEAIELFNKVNGTDYNGIIAPTETVAFYPEQIKEVANQKPTADKDIRFSLSDNDYLDAVNRGDMEAAQQMVNAAAKAAGYSDDMSWKMQHSAPNSKDDISLVALKDSGLVPNDYWDHPEWYTYGAEERESFNKVKDAIRMHELRVAKGKDYIPTMIWVYRAVDKTVNAREGTFRNGDWVTPSRAYAENEGQMNPKGYRIIKDLVPIKDLYWDGNSIAELGYDDGNSYAYADTKNNRKLLDPVTYDDAGNVIPLSKRFKKRVDDTRYSLSNIGEQHTSDSLSALRYDAPVAENSTQQHETQLTEENATLAPVTVETIDAPIYESNDKSAPEGQTAMFEPVEGEKKQTRKEYHQDIIDNIKDRFDEKGFDFDKVLKSAKNLSTWSTVDNTPQRVMEKALGYKEGGILADMTVNKVAQNETEGIKWLNSYVKQLKQISKQYGIKPGSKESAAAQMFAEGFFVNENNEIVRYGEPELIQDFGDADVRRRIKGLARDPRIRKIYDDTLGMINESRTRNLYPEIPRLDNYFLHFRAMEDTFSTLGLPFNPNDIRAKDLPTDLNGVTADLKPGQPFFSSAMHRKGKRTSFDLLGGVERYLNSAKNQIYHIDDIQTLRALRNYIAETYGQATGLEDIDSLTDAEAEERIKQVYDSHLSTFAKFLNEEANVLAGKTALIDRGIEGIIGRRGITFLNALNKQVGSNMVGYNVSSSLTNFLPVAQAFAKTNKFDFTKAFTQTVANKLSGGRFDSFAEDSPVVIRRKGEDRFYRTPWQKMADPGYALMGMVDDISTEIIARTKYNEFIRKGMDSQKAHFETDKWVSKLMGDRSLGQQPQLYNSKMLGLVTKFQLEVRNQLDSQFYDTIQETKVSNEHIQNGLARNAKTAAKVASVFTQLAVAQHLYGMAFESMAGYNPAFDIIEVLMTAFGFDDEEDSEDTLKDNLGQGFEAFMEDLPYASIITGGGRIPISSALPIKEFFKGEDQYGNEKSRWETLGEVAPYYLMPGGYGQVKKTTQGLKMFSDDHPIAGSYTDAGNLRYDVEDTVGSRIKAGIFGQYASENAQKYFDQEQRTLNPEQTEIFAGLNIPIEEYWEYRDNLYAFYDVRDALKDAAYADGATDEDVLRYTYINNIYGDIYDLYDKQKELASGTSRGKTLELRQIQKQMEQMLSESKFGVDSMKLAGAYAEVGGVRYNKDADSGRWYEIKPKNADGSDNWYYQKEQEVTKGLGISYEEYWNNREEYNYAYDKPGKYAIAQAVGGFDSYMEHYDVLENWQSDNYLGADKDEKGNSISGSRKTKVIDYINGLDADYGEKIILYRTVYSSKADKRTYNQEIIDYLNGRDDISYEQMKSILEELDMEVDSEGNVSW